MEKKISGINERTNGVADGVADSLDKVRASASPSFGLEVSPELVRAPTVHDFAYYALRRGFGDEDDVRKVHGGARRRMVVAARQGVVGRGGGGAATRRRRACSGEKLSCAGAAIGLGERGFGRGEKRARG